MSRWGRREDRDICDLCCLNSEYMHILEIGVSETFQQYVLLRGGTISIVNSPLYGVQNIP